ncbi:UDP-N-acetylmuramoyl-tripeptide--D-alanyl-D-alanine ligase, partial [Breznakia sp. OttesenSCG-928-G09]|nr:UDP-N-acetylmuramoyl-tripeptide--D-alanyl-D-alanine ligase [Breznakia sp. OttesenSCG-928-G09]
KDTDYVILEMGMENLEDIHFLNAIAKPDLGIVTNVGIAHLENLKTIENIGRAKLELMDGLDDRSLFIYNGDDSILSKVIQEKDMHSLKIETFGLSEKNSIYLTSFEQEMDVISFKTNVSSHTFRVKTLGRHQALNTLPVLLCAYYVGLDDEVIQKGLNSYVSTGMRNELLQVCKMTILNDAYKSNPQSAKAALDTFEGIASEYKIIVLGDMLDLGPNTNDFHYDVGEYLNAITYDELICFGELSKFIIDGAKAKKPDKKYFHAKTHDEIFAYLEKFKDKDCAVLFKGSRGMKLDEIVDRLIGD